MKKFISTLMICFTVIMVCYTVNNKRVKEEEETKIVHETISVDLKFDPERYGYYFDNIRTDGSLSWDPGVYSADEANDIIAGWSETTSSVIVRLYASINPPDLDNVEYRAFNF